LNKLILLLVILIHACFVIACSSNVDDELNLSRNVSNQLGAQLKNKLITTIQSEGPEAAISVCNMEAMKISADISEKNNLEVGRTWQMG
jgi:hypothetical protein